MEPPLKQPLRLRAACNSCHAAKVRCSGERTGCRRCQELGYDCVYVESMVGRTRGRQGRPSRHDASRQKSSASSQSSSSQQGNNTFASQPDTHEPRENPHPLWPPMPIPPDGRSSVCSDFDFVGRGSFWEQAPGEGYSTNGDIFLEMLEDPSVNFFDDQTDQMECYLPAAEADVANVVHLTQPTNTQTARPNHLAQQQQQQRQRQRQQQEQGQEQEEEEDQDQQQQQQHNDLPPEPKVTGEPDSSKASSAAPRPTTASTNTPIAPGLVWRESFPDSLQLAMPCGQLSTRTQSIMACASILSCVEEMCDSAHALDQALRINKESMNRISQLVNSPCFRESPGSLVVLVQGLQQTVGFLERSCRDLYPSLQKKDPSGRRCGGEQQADQKDTRIGGLRQHPPMGLPAQALPGIGFGCFHIDPEEQKEIQATIISRELGRTLDVIKSLARPLAGFVGEGRAGMEFARQSLRDLEQRISHIELCVDCSK